MTHSECVGKNNSTTVEVVDQQPELQESHFLSVAMAVQRSCSLNSSHSGFANTVFRFLSLRRAHVVVLLNALEIQ